MSATKVAVILTMEVVFAAIFAVLVGGESLSLQNSIGGVMVVVAMYLIVIREEK
jgi:drug/metabolite transporter (DMT)-like permease